MQTFNFINLNYSNHKKSNNNTSLYIIYIYINKKGEKKGFCSPYLKQVFKGEGCNTPIKFYPLFEGPSN